MKSFLITFANLLYCFILIGSSQAKNGPLAVAFSADGKWIATGGKDKTVQVWDSANGNLLHMFPVDDRRIWSVAFHPTGRILAAVGTGGIVQLFDLMGVTPLLSWDAGLGALFSVAFSPDGSQLAVTSADSNEVKIFDAVTGKELFTLTGHSGLNPGNPILAFSPDGTRVINGGRDATARIWDTTSGRLLLTLTGHTSTVNSVTFSNDSAKVATGSNDGTVRIWDSSTGQELMEVHGYGVLFTPDARHLIITDDDGVKILALGMDELVQIAKSHLTRDLTIEECQKYLHVDACPVSLH